MMAIQGQVAVLTKLMTSKQQQHQLQQFQLHQQLHQQQSLHQVVSSSVPGVTYCAEDGNSQVISIGIFGLELIVCHSLIRINS